MTTVPPYRIGLIVPSSNVTMETEIPALLRAYEGVTGLPFTFHGARMRMKQVTAEALLAMDREGATCAAHLADAQCDVLAYACLVAAMASGPRRPTMIVSTIPIDIHPSSARMTGPASRSIAGNSALMRVRLNTGGNRSKWGQVPCYGTVPLVRF